MKKSITTLLILILGIHLMAQDPGDLDEDYGVNGISIISLADNTIVLRSMGMQSNNRLIISGYMSDEITGENDLLAFRLTELGDVDAFGNQGIYFLENFSFAETFNTCTVLPDDKILLGGDLTMEYHPIIAQLHEDGAYDLSFGGDGSYSMMGYTFRPLNILTYATDDGYNILVGGYSESGIPELILINQDGLLVNSFGNDGILTEPSIDGTVISTAIDESNGHAYCCILDNTIDGKIFVMKFNMYTGELDNSFGSNGIQALDPFGDATSFSPSTVILEADMTRISIFGYYDHIAGDTDLFAVRLNTADGSIDNSFGLNGWSALRIPGSNELSYDAIRQSDGRFYLGGFTTFAGTNDYMVVRIENNGVLDTGFGDAGFFIQDIDGSDKISQLLLNENESRLYCGGSSYSASFGLVHVCSLHTGYNNCVEVSESNIENAEFNIYPNPCQDILHIDYAGSEFYSIEICDLSGRSVFAQEENEEQISIDIYHLPKGIYILSLQTLNGIISKKLIR